MRVASYNSYKRIRRIHVDPALGQVLAGKLTRAQLSTYYAAKMRGSKKKKPLAETTVAHHHAMLKTAYNWALEEELLAREPGAARQEPARAQTEDAPRLEHGGDREHRDQRARGLQVHAAGVLAGFSGLRVGEIAGLLWSDLDLTRGFVTVCRTIEEDEDGTLLEYPPKNGKARAVPLPAAACDELRVWLAAQKEYRLAQGPAWNEAGRVVPKKDGTPDGALDPEEPVVELGRPPEDRPAPADPRPQGLLRHLGLRDLRSQAGAGVARPLRPGDHAAALRAADDGGQGEGRGWPRRGDAGRAREGRGEGSRGRAAREPDNVVAAGQPTTVASSHRRPRLGGQCDRSSTNQRSLALEKRVPDLAVFIAGDVEELVVNEKSDEALYGAPLAWRVRGDPKSLVLSPPDGVQVVVGRSAVGGPVIVVAPDPVLLPRPLLVLHLGAPDRQSPGLARGDCEHDPEEVVVVERDSTGDSVGVAVEVDREAGCGRSRPHDREPEQEVEEVAKAKDDVRPPQAQSARYWSSLFCSFPASRGGRGLAAWSSPVPARPRPRESQRLPRWARVCSRSVGAGCRPSFAAIHRISPMVLLIPPGPATDKAGRSGDPRLASWLMRAREDRAVTAGAFGRDMRASGTATSATL